MEVNLSAEVVSTVCKALRSEKSGLKRWLEVSLPNGKANPDKKEEMENNLSEVEGALAVFEELEELMR